MPWRKTWFRCFLAVAAVPLLCVALGISFVLAEFAAGKFALSSVRGQLEASGVLLPLSRLAPGAPPEAVENGVKLLKVLEEIEPLARKYPYALQGPETMELESPGVAKPVASRQLPILHMAKGASPLSWTELRSQYEEASPILTHAREIWRKPVGLKHEQSSLKLRLETGGLQKYGFWLRTGAILEVHDGNFHQAVENLRELRQASEVLGSSKMLVSHVLELGMWTFALFGTVWEVLQEPAVPESELIEIQEILSQGDFVEGSNKAMQVEMAIAPDVNAEIAKRSSQMSSWGMLSTPGPEWLVPLRNTLWPYVWKDGDLARVLAFWRAPITLGRELSVSRNWSAVRSKIPEDVGVSSYDEWRFPFSALTDIRTVKSLLLSAVRVEARRELALASVGLARYKIANGRYPATLAELVPGILPKAPHDWFDGQSLKYRLLPDGKYLLYSVGEDGVDDGGDPVPPDGKKAGLNNGRDLVWPSASGS